MLGLAAALSALMGLTLGLFGGGGSILAVPILLYVVGTGPKEAIATSLLVVGATSLLCVLQHARSGHVRWRTGLVFGGVGMIGAYGGGLAAAWFSGTALLLLFAAMMVAAAVAMLLPRRDAERDTPRQPSMATAAIEGLVVGAVTGLVGAGGGFLVVPALVLFGGLDMRAAVGTSTLVIAMKSFAGFAGYAGHVAIDPQVTALVIAAAMAGSVGGSLLLRRLDPAKLRRAFGGFVLVMAAFIAVQQAPPELVDALLVERWPFWAGGLAIGAFVLLFRLATGKALGVSTGFYDACRAPFEPEARRSWRLPFLVGIVGGGLLAAWLAGGLTVAGDAGLYASLVPESWLARAALFTGGGVLLGYGARVAGGCTSGHGIVGTALMARASLTATAVFMVTGVAVTHLMRLVAGA